MAVFRARHSVADNVRTGSVFDGIAALFIQDTPLVSQVFRYIFSLQFGWTEVPRIIYKFVRYQGRKLIKQVS